MNKRIYSLIIVLAAVSVSALLLGVYLLTTKTSVYPQLFIETCAAVFKNITTHLHLNPDGVASSAVLLTSILSAFFVGIQLLRFMISHLQLHFNSGHTHVLPKKLQSIIENRQLQAVSFSVIAGKPTAYTIGLFRPRIILSAELIKKVSYHQLEAIVLHEFYHLRNFHLLWLLFSRLVSSFLFFIPIIKFLYHQLQTEFEFAADAFVVAEQKTNLHLRQSLVFNLEYKNGVIPYFATSPIEKRVALLLTQKTPSNKIGKISLSLSILSFVVMSVLAITSPSQIVARFYDDSISTDCTSDLDISNTESNFSIQKTFSSSVVTYR